MSIATYQNALDTIEFDSLCGEWGTFPLQEAPLLVDAPFLTGKNQRIASDGRRAEICYVMHRGDVADGLLFHIKTFYPTGAYRLPTGGIHQGEKVMETLVREIAEETSLRVGPGSDQVQVQSCLGVLHYSMQHRTLGQTIPFATYHFLVQMPKDATVVTLDPEEHIGGWEWRKAEDLGKTADYLEHVGDSNAVWGDWGRFRALSHRFVATRLAQLFG